MNIKTKSLTVASVWRHNYERAGHEFFREWVQVGLLSHVAQLINCPKIDSRN